MWQSAAGARRFDNRTEEEGRIVTSTPLHSTPLHSTPLHSTPLRSLAAAVALCGIAVTSPNSAFAHEPDSPGGGVAIAPDRAEDPSRSYERALERRDEMVEQLVHRIVGASYGALFLAGWKDETPTVGAFVEAVRGIVGPWIRQALERQWGLEPNFGAPVPAPTPGFGPGDVQLPPDLDIDDSPNPCDMPTPGVPAYMECSPDQIAFLSEGWHLAFYETWRARQYLQATQEDLDLWYKAWDGVHALEKWQVANWFGDGSPAAVALRRDEILASYDDIWDKYLTGQEDLTLRCYQPPEWWEVVFTPWQTAYAWPCWAGAIAHHWFEGTVVLCDPVFDPDPNAPYQDPIPRGSLLVHEMLHYTINAFGLIRDRHVGVHCGADSACYGADDSLHLAADHPAHAATNNDNYGLFAQMYAASYLEPGPIGDDPDAPVLPPCNQEGICFETDTTAPGCQPPPDAYDTCPDPNDPLLFGYPGCPCADVDIVKFEDTANEGGYPDGSGSYLVHGLTYGPGQYCTSATDGTDAVCGTTVINGVSYPVCQVCGVDTMLGCACQNHNECTTLEASDGPLRCWGLQDDGWGPSPGGICLPDDGTPAGRERLSEMPWFCVDNCEALAPGQGWPMACVFDQSPDLDFPHGECVDLIGCGGLLPGECEASGRRCDQQADACVDECVFDSDCTKWGFPPHYVCNAQFGSPGRCVPPACANPKSAEFGGPYCALFE